MLTSPNHPRERVAYLDVLKFLGILFIYVGHYTTSAGLIYQFVFKFHVALFFFLSGCTETFNKETSLVKNIYKKFLNILLPFYLFAFISIIVHVLAYGGTPSDILTNLKIVASGCIRNTFLASSLWFLSCLFVVSVIFEILKTFINKAFLLLIALCLFISMVGGYLTFPKFYNIDSALYYFIYYVVGYLSFNRIHQLITSKRTIHKVVVVVSGFLTMLYTALLFFGHNVLSWMWSIPYIGSMCSFFTSMIPILFFLLCAYILRDCAYLAALGKSTLYFCCSEFIVKCSVSTFLSIFFPVNVHNGLSAILFSFVLLALSQKYLIPIEEKMLAYVKAFFPNPSKHT